MTLLTVRLDAGHDFRRAFRRLDGREAANAPLDDRIVGPLDQIGRLFDDVEDKIDETPDPSHGLSMDRLMVPEQSAPIRTMSKQIFTLMVVVLSLLGALGCKNKGPVPGSENGPSTETTRVGAAETTGAHPGAANPQQGSDPHAGVAMNGAPRGAAPEVDASGMLDVGALKFKVPNAWSVQTPKSSMRQAQLKAEGEAGAAELVVFYFGPQGAGSPKENIDRWIGQFSNPDGSPVTNANIALVKVGQQEVTRVEVAGQYASTMAQPGQAAAPQSGQRLLAAIVETGNGPYYFKFLGPDETVTAHAAAFDGLLQSIVAVE